MDDPLNLYKTARDAFRPDDCMIYAAFVTLKNQYYISFSRVYICSINRDGNEVPFDRKYPRLKIFYNNVGSLVYPEYKTVIVNLSDVWLIGKAYYSPVPEYYYEDNTGVNHPNARAALEKKGY